MDTEGVVMTESRLKEVTAEARGGGSGACERAGLKILLGVRGGLLPGLLSAAVDIFEASMFKRDKVDRATLKPVKNQSTSKRKTLSALTKRTLGM